MMTEYHFTLSTHHTEISFEEAEKVFSEQRVDDITLSSSEGVTRFSFSVEGKSPSSVADNARALLRKIFNRGRDLLLIITIDEYDVRDFFKNKRIGCLEYLRSIGCSGWFGSAGITPPVLPRIRKCILCDKRRAHLWYQQCADCWKERKKEHDVGGLSSSEEFELSELPGGSTATGVVSRQPWKMRHGHEPVHSDIRYNGD